MGRLLGVVGLGLVVVGVAAADTGPLSVTVIRGTHMSGDAASLAAIDGDTFNIAPEARTRRDTTKWFAWLRANYGEQQPGTLTINHAVSVEWDLAVCTLHVYSGRTKIARSFINSIDQRVIRRSFTAALENPGIVTVKVTCWGWGNYRSLRVEELTVTSG